MLEDINTRKTPAEKDQFADLDTAVILAQAQPPLWRQLIESQLGLGNGSRRAPGQMSRRDAEDCRGLSQRECDEIRDMSPNRRHDYDQLDHDRQYDYRHLPKDEQRRIDRMTPNEQYDYWHNQR